MNIQTFESISAYLRSNRIFFINIIICGRITNNMIAIYYLIAFLLIFSRKEYVIIKKRNLKSIEKMKVNSENKMTTNNKTPLFRPVKDDTKSFLQDLVLSFL